MWQDRFRRFLISDLMVARFCVVEQMSVASFYHCKLRTKKGRETYAKRTGMIEPIFGQIKQARGFRQFLLRGMDNMRGEWSLICMTHNLLKLFQMRELAMA